MAARITYTTEDWNRGENARTLQVAALEIDFDADERGAIRIQTDTQFSHVRQEASNPTTLQIATGADKP